MKRTIRKRILSGLLAVMMIVSNVNVSTYAAEDGQIVHELEADPENADGGQAEEVTENTDVSDEGQNSDDASQEQNDAESAESKDTDAAESKESEKETETQDQSEAETSAASKENTSTAETADTKTLSSVDSKNESSAAETKESSKDKQENVGGAGASGLSTGESAALTTTESTTAESTTAAESQTTLAETLAEEVDSSPVNLSAQDTVKIRYSVNKWWILCEKELSTDTDAEGDDLDLSTATEEYKQSVTGTRKRKELLTDSENTTESTAAQTSEKENVVETTNANTSESSAAATESTENPTSAADTESTAESEASKDSKKNQFVEVYNFGQYNYAPSMTMGFDVSFSLNKKYSVKKETENSESGKTVTETVSREVNASDYLTFTLPKELKDLSIELPEDAYYSYETEGLESGETKVTITLDENVPDAERLSGKLHLTFTMDMEALDAGEGTCEIVLFGKTYQLVFGGEYALETIAVNSFTIVGNDISFEETLGGIDWKDLVRPATFKLPIQLVQHYTVNNESQAKTVSTQENNADGNYYLRFTHDGAGGGSFKIENVPKQVTVDDQQITVDSYDVQIDTSSLPYYTCESQPIDNILEEDKAIVSLTLRLESRTLTLKPTVSPEDTTDSTGFKFNVVFNNPEKLNGESISTQTIKKDFTAQANSPTVIIVPAGIGYSVTQEAADGYRLDTNYSVSGGSSDGTAQKSSATGQVTSDVTVTTTNYNQNQTYKFIVNWVDNAKKDRPSVTAGNFKLQYRTVTTSDGETGYGEWTDVANGNISNSAVYDAATAAVDNTYYYRKLPAVDNDGKTVEYQVVPTAPSGYKATSVNEDGTQVITFEEQLSFGAYINWNDTDNTSMRPFAETVEGKLKLYRRTGTGNYEKVTDSNLTINRLTAFSASWYVEAENLPRYDQGNNEYDYVLVQGGIESTDEQKNKVNQEDFDNYEAHYNNKQGSYGNDVTLCHNGGYITEVLQDNANFEAIKIWKDSGDSTDRPKATMTLWRYSKGTAQSIDEAYTSGMAAQVIYLTKQSNEDGSYKTDKNGTILTTDNIASYALTGIENEETISFEYIKGVNLTLSKYDDQGREYVYFVRETLSGDAADEYETSYSGTVENEDGTETTVEYKNGAPTGGTVTNVRRKKEAVTITKIWKNPSGLSGIDGVSVQAEIQASADGGVTYDTLTVYSDVQDSYKELTGEDKTAAQTITGFTSTIAQSEVTYYVNTYNSEGKLYDMTTARIVEKVIGKGEKTEWTSSSSDVSKGTTTVTDSSDNQYNVKTSFTAKTTLAGGMKQYRYTQTNTITATREYKLIKEWDSKITDEEFSDISSIKFTLERRSTKDNADGSQAAYEQVGEAGQWIVERGSNRTWTQTITNLPKYDDEGYEYYYRAEEVSFVKTDGLIETVVERADAKAYGERRWVQTYYRTPDQTKVVNHIPSPGSGFFTASKIWRDNGDSDKHGNVVLRIYDREQLKNALNSASDYSDGDVVDLGSLQLNNAALKSYDVTLTKNGQYTAYINYKNIDSALEISDKTSGSDVDSSASTSSNHSLKDYVVFEYTVDDNANVVTKAFRTVLRLFSESKNDYTAKYTYAQLKAAADEEGNYSLSGTVSNSSRQYNTTTTANAGDSTLTITNTRTGITSLAVNKTWQDDNNREKSRASKIQFQLYRDGEKYTGIPSNVTVTASDITREGKTFASCDVELNHASGVITVGPASGDTANTEGLWTFKVENLDMFSETAVPYIYNMDELAEASIGAENGIANKSFSYTQKKTSTVGDSDGKTQEFSFNFINTISGTTDHVAYKYWKDASIGAAYRPDLYLKLYRCLKKDYDNAVEKAGASSDTENSSENTTESEAGVAQPSVDVTSLCEKYTNYKDLVWTKENENEGKTDYEKSYDWKITVENLPMFDDDGNEYIYFFTESMNNNGLTVKGTYTSSSVTKKLSNGNTYEVFTNTIADEMQVSGKKIWSGLSSYQTTELPDPVITLYRTTASDIENLQVESDSEIEELLSAGTITEVDKTFLTGTTDEAGNTEDKTAYSFPNVYGLNPETHQTVTSEKLQQKVADGLLSKDETSALPKYMLPKYDSEGNRYTYLVRETIPDRIASQLYIGSNDNGTFSNKFKTNVNRRQITVTKNWRRENVYEAGTENQYPSVTFTLYRYEAGKEDTTTKEIETHTINASEFKNSTDGNASASYVFEDLLVYSPTGAQYFYYITETGINGYTVKYSDEDDITDSALLGKTIYTGTDTNGESTELTIDNDLLNDLKENNRIDVISLPANWNEEDTENNTNVSTTNTYVKDEKIKISGSKVWQDYHNFAGLRPSDAQSAGFDVTLTRRTGNQDKQANKVDATTINLKDLTTASDDKRNDEQDPYIVWDYHVDADKNITATNSDEWTYTICNLPKYAANGMPYVYTLSEKMDVLSEAYSKSQVSAEVGSDKNPDGNGIVQNGNMVNRYAGSYTVVKNWYDGGDLYGLRPTNVTIVLQRAKSTDNKETWSGYENITLKSNQVGNKKKDAKTGEEVEKNDWENGYPSVVQENGNSIISVKLTSADVMANTEGRTWKYTFTNLPMIGMEDGQQVYYTYRCVETEIGGIKVSEDNYGVSKAGAYKREDSTITNARTTIGNTLSSTTELTVTKNWDENDQSDYYYTRPEKITFKLQKRSSKQDSTWQDVTATSGSDSGAYTFTISKDDKTTDHPEGWSKKLSYLPGIEVEAVNETEYKQYAVSYRAVEIHEDAESGNNILEAALEAVTGMESTVVRDAKNYTDITTYDDSASQGAGDDAENETAIASQSNIIRNKLLVDNDLGTISVTKKWYTASTNPQTATFELLYKKAADSTDQWHCYAGITVPADSDWSKHAQSESTATAAENGHKCLVKTVTSETPVNNEATANCEWSNLPKYDLEGNLLAYKVVEHAVNGYTSYVDASKRDGHSEDLYETNYTFTNVENQSYSVKKIWDIPSGAAFYAENQSGKFTATFKLQQKTATTDWVDVQKEDASKSGYVKGYKDKTLYCAANIVRTPLTGAWSNLPKYDENGNQLIYRAVETKVNNIAVKNDTNGAYVASYKYGSGNDTSDRTNDSQFGDTMTTVTNRMVYGFVNLAKKAAYLAEGGITADTDNGSLQGVKFNIYSGTNATPYASNVETDENGNLKHNNGKYGDEQKYLVAGTYTLKEASSTAGTGYSVWANGIEFTVGADSSGILTQQNSTGEHGTALISTNCVGIFTLGLKVQYKAAADVEGKTVSTHSLDDGCVPSETSDAAYDLESRGVISFTKVGDKSTNSGNTYEDLDTHSSAVGEDTAYFGVYLDEACTQQVAGMVPRATIRSVADRTAEDWRTMVLTDKALDGTTKFNIYKTVTLDADGKASISSASNIPSSNNGSSKTYKIPYLRSNWETGGTSDTTKNYPYTLLAGTYYIKELCAPAGYRLDTTVRKAVVDELKITAEVTTDLKTSYVDNNAKLSMVGSSEAASNVYKWSNNPTVVTLYKLDQFGQNVSLAENGYLTLTISGAGNSSDETENNTFPNGAETIRLYQNADTPAKWFGSDGREISNVTNSYITYNSADGNWTIKGLLDADKTYTLKEPESSVDADHNIAASITFSVNADGSITMQNTEGTEDATIAASETPLTANGNDADQMNSYKSNPDSNQIVMRDTTNLRKDLVLQKVDSETSKSIANISFKLYKYSELDTETGAPTDAVDVLGKDKNGNEIYLKTDENGKIQLSKLDASIKNKTITDPKNAEEKLALKYGLDVGKYYLQEVEGGASDQYKLADKLYFEIKKDTDKTAVNNYNEYAAVVLTESTAEDKHVSVTTDAKVNNGVTTITLKNDPAHNKTLVLTKVDSDDASKKLAGAKFTLSYESANKGHEGASKGWTESCVTGNDGLLYLEDTKGAATTAQPDISAKGTYTLKETKAAAGYMTRAEKDGLTVLTFKVDTNNKITDVKCYDAESADGMVTAEVENSIEEGRTSEHKNLKVTVKNESTEVSAQIFSDIAKSDAKKSCNQKDLSGEDLYGTHLEIYKGTETGIKASASNVAVLSSDKQNGWSWKNASGTAGDGTYLPAGTLKENIIYTLHESGAPVGYMAGGDIYFTLSGTTTQKNAEGKNETVSQLYVWIGDGTPNANDAADINLADDKKWNKITNVKDNVLTMVDEAIIAPVDLQKVLASVDIGSFKALEGAEFEVAVRNTVVEGAAASAAESKTVLGTAVTTKKGYLVWKSITEAGYKYGRIFNAEGTRVSAANKDTAIGKTIVLQQNAEGYAFTETKAPDTAYNDGLSFHVQITKENYLEYRTVTGTGEAKTLTYHTDKYINLVEAEKNTKSDIPYSVQNEADRSGKTEYTDADVLAVNREYRSVVTLHKYDASTEGQKAAIAGTEFTLYRDSVSKDNIYKKAYIVEKEGDDRKTALNESGVFTTDADGNITIEIREKGTYILKETKASAGYVLDDANLLTFVLKDEAEAQSLAVNGNSAPVYGYGTTANVLKKDENGVPNLREEVPVTPTEPETQPETQPETETSSESHKSTSSGSHGGSGGGGSSVSSMHAVITATEAESQTAAETVAETAAESVGSGSGGNTSGGEAAEYDPDGDVKNARRNKNRNGKKTGDSQKPVIWISLICGAAALVGGVEFFDRRKRKKKDDTK